MSSAPTRLPAPTLPGVRARTVRSARIETRVLFTGPDDGTPVLFLHGNLSSATWWEETMRALPPGCHGVAPDMRGFGDADRGARIDATRGLGDLADDAFALLDALGIEEADVVACSLGGGVVWRMLMDAPGRLRSATLAAPGSPYGFGGTADAEGTLIWPDHAGTGAGIVHPELVRLLAAGDRTGDNPFSPLNALRRLVWNPPFIPAREDALLDGTLRIHQGADAYPGDTVPSPNWPFFAPGVAGPNNAVSPKYAGPVERLWEGAGPRPPILWIRGDRDVAVSDSAASDPGTLGRAGFIPGWPGEDVFPPQPMLRQIRRVLERYGAAGGTCREVVLEGAGHVPFLERAAEFDELLHRMLADPAGTVAGV
jgi:pimeloyl-ACP methyl ester carboxylesterase